MTRRFEKVDTSGEFFAIDVLACACGGRLRFIATIEDPAVIERIPRQVELPASTAERAPARPPNPRRSIRSRSTSDPDGMSCGVAVRLDTTPGAVSGSALEETQFRNLLDPLVHYASPAAVALIPTVWIGNRA